MSEPPSTLWGVGPARVLGPHFFSTHTPLAHGSICIPDTILPFVSILSYFKLWYPPFEAGSLILGTAVIWGWLIWVVGMWGKAVLLALRFT